MDKQEAKMILQAYRPDDRDADDPAFAEALHLAGQDPELGAWFEQQQSLDRAISERLHEAPVPEDLRNAILAGFRSETPVLVPVPRSWWRSPALAWAAAIVLLFAAAVVFKDSGSPGLVMSAYRDAMTDHLDNGVAFDEQSENPDTLIRYLARGGRFTGLQLPQDLATAKSIGCQVFQYRSTESALICFSLPTNEVVHLFVADADRFLESEVSQKITFAECGKWKTVTWRGDKQVFLLAGNVPGERLLQLAGESSR